MFKGKILIFTFLFQRKMLETYEELPPPSFAGSAVPKVRVRKGITHQSAKSKGRRLQQYAERKFKEAFPHDLVGNDVKSLSMGAPGDDLILSPAALQILPYNFEMKNVEDFKIWETIKQMYKRRAPDCPTLPCIVVKRNHVDPVAFLPAVHFCRLLFYSLVSKASPQVSPDQITEKWAGLSELASMTDICAFFKVQLTSLSEAMQLLLQFTFDSLNCITPYPQSPAGVSLQSINSNSWIMSNHQSRTMNFWKQWDDLKLACPKRMNDRGLIVFNRDDYEHTIYVAFDYHRFVTLLQDRWTVVKP